MSKGKSDKITYKPYEQHQIYLIPPNAEELIPKDHLVRLVKGCDVCLWELFCVFSFWIVWHGALAMLFCPFLSRAFRGVFSAQKRAVVTEKKAERKRSFFNLYNFEPSTESEKFFTFACRSWGENK